MAQCMLCSGPVRRVRAAAAAAREEDARDGRRAPACDEAGRSARAGRGARAPDAASCVTGYGESSDLVSVVDGTTSPLLAPPAIFPASDACCQQ
jgi:hypothetical protein